MPRKLPDGEHEFRYVVPLRDAYRAPRKKRAKVAIRLLREFVARHFRYSGAVRISERLNELIWSRSIEKPPRKVVVNVKVKVEGGEIVSAEVHPAGEQREEIR